MIDWFPTSPDRFEADSGQGYGRWRASIDLRRVAGALDSQEPGNAGHSERVARMVRRMAGAAGWSAAEAGRLSDAALVHDVGKALIPHELLVATRRLTPVERSIVRAHPGHGARMARGILDDDQIGWIRHHHERWDGRGYPDRLGGDAIPEGARLLAVADAADAMTHRPRSGPLPPAAALDECIREAGHQFCAAAVAALARVGLPGDPRRDGPPAPLRLSEG